MRQHRETEPRRCERVRAFGAAAIFVVVAVGCDTDTQPRLNVPTAPISPVAGPIATEVRAIENVRGVTLEAVGIVDIRLGAVESLTIVAPERVISLLTSDVVGGELILGRDSSSYQGRASDIRYDLRLRQLNRLALHGAGTIVAEGIRTDELSVTLGGVGDVQASGRVDRQTVHMAGVGAYLAPGLESRVTELSLTSGRAEVWATERIVGVLNAGCLVEYWGDPEIEVHGLGTLRRLGPKS